MSDEGDKTCPLCAEEMDLTDQQLRPCKCGYEICVWCWHHIMDMAEKDNTDGRCPACRTPYNKEKIVGTASKCERLVTVEKKQKSQKGKTRSLEVKKQQLGSVRVIQRNLVYIVGLPLNLADEDLLQQKEYFGRYGKVLKVSISKTATGAIQQFANSTCSVYITYSKEEEAVRSIQSAHGFVLEGRTLRARFGTTKYCHAWLRNAPCTNAECLYLHEFGPQEDSFTKDEIISAYTRNRVQQITGVTNEMQRRSGNLLPPPLDDYSVDNTTSAWPKPVSKITTNNPANGIKVPLPNISSGKSAASWGTRASNSQLNSSKDPSNQKTDTSTTTVSSNGDELVKEKGGLGNSISTKEDVGRTDENIPDKLPSSEIHRHDSDPVVDEEERRISPLSVDMSTNIIKNNQISEPCESKQFSEALTANETETITKNKISQVAISEAEEDTMCFDNQRLMDTQVIQNGHYPVHADPLSSSSHHNTPVVNGYSSSVIGDSSREVSNGHSYFDGTEGRNGQNGGLESSIISNILAMDFDPWDETLTSPRNLAKFLGGSNKQEKVRKAQNSNQSRFSFARQDYGDFGLGHKNSSSDFVGNGSIYVDKKKVNNGNGFPCFSYGESENFATNYFSMSENNNKIPVNVTRRAQVSAGISGPNRAPPPGFTSQEQLPFDNLSLSGNHQHMFDSSLLLHETAAVNMGNDLMDPAILAVGSARVNNSTPPPTAGLDMMMRSSSNYHLNSFENDVRLQLLMQRCSFSQQNPPPTRFSDSGLNYQTDSYGIPSNNFLSRQQTTGFQQQAMRRSSYQSTSSNGRHWNGNDVAAMVRNERLGGFNTSRYYSKFHNMPNSAHLYNNTTTFGI